MKICFRQSIKNCCNACVRVGLFADRLPVLLTACNPNNVFGASLQVFECYSASGSSDMNRCLNRERKPHLPFIERKNYFRCCMFVTR